jgi:GMP synthase (glutamine-hydrolysing)
MQAACQSSGVKRPESADYCLVDGIFCGLYDAAMRVHYVQHVGFEDSANIGAWAVSRGHGLTTTRAQEGEAFPKAAEIDWLVIMGGLMNVYQHRDYPWLIDEKKLIEEAIGLNKTVVGVCLGAQLTADVLGGKVFRNAYKEIGSWPVTLTAAGRNSALFATFPDSFEAVHWHGDTFSLPEGATLMASSEACENQIFTYGGNVLALQCHLEYSEQSVEKMLSHCGDEIDNSPYVQPAEQIRQSYRHLAKAKELLFDLLDKLAEAKPL